MILMFETPQRKEHHVLIVTPLGKKSAEASTQRCLVRASVAHVQERMEVGTMQVPRPLQAESIRSDFEF